MNELANKARTAAASARLLFEAGDYDGAVSRAYYAMFDAARAYLEARHGIAFHAIKTHAGVLAEFSKLGVKQDCLAPEIGPAFNRATVRRAQADYDVIATDCDAAAATLQDLTRFIDAVLTEIQS